MAYQLLHTSSIRDTSIARESFLMPTRHDGVIGGEKLLTVFVSVLRRVSIEV